MSAIVNAGLPPVTLVSQLLCPASGVMLARWTAFTDCEPDPGFVTSTLTLAGLPAGYNVPVIVPAIVMFDAFPTVAEPVPEPVSVK
jgi:hypothetical protein